jgi:hypothetical protein
MFEPDVNKLFLSGFTSDQVKEYRNVIGIAEDHWNEAEVTKRCTFYTEFLRVLSFRIELVSVLCLGE